MTRSMLGDDDFDGTDYLESASDSEYELTSSPQRLQTDHLRPSRARAHPHDHEPNLPVPQSVYWNSSYPVGLPNSFMAHNYWAPSPQQTAFHPHVTSLPPSAFYLQPFQSQSNEMHSTWYSQGAHSYSDMAQPAMSAPASMPPYSYTAPACGQYNSLQSSYIDDRHLNILDNYPLEVPLPSFLDSEPPTGDSLIDTAKIALTPEETPELASARACPPSFPLDPLSKFVSKTRLTGYSSLEPRATDKPKSLDSFDSAADPVVKIEPASPPTGIIPPIQSTKLIFASKEAPYSNNITKGPSYIPQRDANLPWVLSGYTEHMRRLRALRLLLRPDCGLDDVSDLMAICDMPPVLLLGQPLFPGMGIMQFFPFRKAPAPPSYIPLNRKPLSSTAPELYVSWSRRSEEDTDSKKKRLRKSQNGPAERVFPVIEEGTNLEIHLTRVISTGTVTWDPNGIMYPLGFIRCCDWMPITALPSILLPPWNNTQFFAVPGGFDKEEMAKESEIQYVELNMYTAPFNRKTSSLVSESYCGMCNSWHPRNSSHWLHHMKSTHGIRASTRLPFPLPHLISHRPDRARKNGFYIGFCDACQSWQNLNCPGSSSSLASWFLHQAMHDVCRNKNRQKTSKRNGADMVPSLQYVGLLYEFYYRRRTVLSMQQIVSDEMKVNGDVGQFSGSVFQMPYFFRTVGSFKDIDPSIGVLATGTDAEIHQQALECIEQLSTITVNTAPDPVGEALVSSPPMIYMFQEFDGYSNKFQEEYAEAKKKARKAESKAGAQKIKAVAKKTKKAAKPKAAKANPAATKSKAKPKRKVVFSGAPDSSDCSESLDGSESSASSQAKSDESEKDE